MSLSVRHTAKHGLDDKPGGQQFSDYYSVQSVAIGSIKTGDGHRTSTFQASALYFAGVYGCQASCVCNIRPKGG